MHRGEHHTLTNEGGVKPSLPLLEDGRCHSLLTLRNVALSLVTMDGLTLMLSCMMDVKL